MSKPFATLKLQNKNDLNSKSFYHLSTLKKVGIGREPTCEIVTDPNLYSSVSRRHAEIELISINSQQVWQICDLSSANGTYINGQHLQGCHLLKPGDCIRLSIDGPEYIFEYKSATPTSPSALQPKASTPEITQLPKVSKSSLQPVIHNQSPKVPAVQSSFGKSIWNINKEDSTRVMVRDIGLLQVVAFSTNNQIVASAADKTIKLWNFSTGEEICTLSGHRLTIHDLNCSTYSEC